MQPLNKVRNPFENALVVNYVRVITEVRAGQITNEYSYEADSYTRLYNSKANRELMFSLSMWARDLILAMQYWVQAGNKHVILPFERVKELYVNDPKYGKRRYDETIRELIKHSIIDYKDRENGEYWYDAKIFASGNRIHMFPESLFKVKTINKTINNID
jgi:hypothetical protein